MSMNKTFILEQQKIARERAKNALLPKGIDSNGFGMTYEDLDTLIAQTILATEEETLARVRGEAITITARLDREFFKGRFSSSGLESIEAIIKDELTPTPVESEESGFAKFLKENGHGNSATSTPLPTNKT